MQVSPVHRRSLRLPPWWAVGLLLLAVGVIWSGGSRWFRPRVEPPAPPGWQRFTAEPTIRVRLRQISESTRVVIAGEGGLRAMRGRDTLTLAEEVVLSPGMWPGWMFSDEPVVLRPVRGDRLTLDGVPYRGELWLRAREGSIDVINHVPLETYLPGVLTGELYSHWHPSAFAAQAIAARSYAMYEMQDRAARAFDVEATAASQMYVGALTHGKAQDAVELTRGMVLTYGPLLVPGYYSSCLGPISQSAAAVFPTAPDIPPLQGRSIGRWGSTSPRYRWGPIERKRATFSQRLAAWGATTSHAVRHLQSLTAIEDHARNSAGRVTTFLLRDRSGKTYTLHAEQFRVAANFTGPGAPPLRTDDRLHSAMVSVRVTGERVIFEEGFGFGHGVGLCQFGTQEMAAAGWTPQAILAFYYPQAELRRAYE